MLKRLRRTLMGLALVAAAVFTSAAAIPTDYFIPLDLIERIECAGGVGSGARIDEDQVLTAAHVASIGSCTVDGQPTEVIHMDGAADLAVLRTASRSSTFIPLACQLPQPGRTYFAVGYAYGRDFVVQRLDGTGDRRWPGATTAHLYRGRVIPGMSGGPVVDERGYIVGIVNALPRDGRPIAISRSLTDTYLCPAGRPTADPREPRR